MIKILTLTGIVLILMPFSRQKFDLKTSIERGKSIYESQCITCHMAEGEGLEGVFPPLVKSNYLANKDILVKIVLMGMRGPIKVNGIDYNSEKPGVMLSDEEVSDLLNYIRNSWGNKGQAILPVDVQPALKTESKGYQPY